MKGFTVRAPKIPAAVVSKLGHYVYVYVNPNDETVFYVGKGKGARALAQLDASEERRVGGVIREIRAAGAEPRIDILAHALPSAEAALQVEAAAIDLLGIENLTNAVRGWRGAKFGRMPLSELSAHYLRRPAKIREPSILIWINKEYRYGMSAAELYDATRSAWKVGQRRRERVELAFAVFEGVVREVYAIETWLPGGTTFNARLGGRAADRSDRWEFVGTIASEAVHDRYVNHYVGHLFAKGAQNPIAYVNVDERDHK